MNMLKLLIQLCVFICITLCSYCQPIQPIKYKDFVFSEITVKKNLFYAINIASDTKKKFYSFDLYQPEPDSTNRRPLIIWMHGGGFKFGSKNATGIKLWCKTFARRGYVSAAINYRLSKKRPFSDIAEFRKSCFNAVQDVRQAVKFFKENYLYFKVDTNCIILAGNSAGGIIALQASYGNNAESAGITKHDNLNFVAHNQGDIAAIINFWGALFDINNLKNAAVPIVSVHGRNDRTVYIDHRNTSFYGSLAIHNRADSLHIPNDLKIYEGYAHELQKHFNPFFVSDATKQRWLEAGEFAADFVYAILFR
jgi:dipeptidyl aminopeptidase/acylaminoacyl peptidase